MEKEKRKRVNSTQRRKGWKRKWWKSEICWEAGCDDGNQNRKEDLKKKQSSEIQWDADCDDGRLSNHVLASNQTGCWTSPSCSARWESFSISNTLHSPITYFFSLFDYIILIDHFFSILNTLQSSITFFSSILTTLHSSITFSAFWPYYIHQLLAQCFDNITFI